MSQVRVVGLVAMMVLAVVALAAGCSSKEPSADKAKPAPSKTEGTAPTASAAALAAGGVAVVPPLDELRGINLTTGSWMLDIGPDGSATVGYGSSAGDFAKVPAGTFDFAEVYKKMVPVVQPGGSTPPFYAVCFQRRGASSTSAVYTQDEPTVLALFEKALAARDNSDAGRLDELLKTYPIALSARR
jgi:hypothetical protein